MIKVLVVDDDHLVRTGFIAIMPWQKHGLEVVGQANNGHKALEILLDHEVDLMITDLAMPGMSGIELMRQVKQLYPNLHMVVLTFHHEFEYAQEAIRLGAIDYITKVELEHEQMDEVLNRIASRIYEREAALVESRGQYEKEQRFIAMESIFVLVSLFPQDDYKWIEQMTVEIPAAVYKLDERLWWIEGERQEDEPALIADILRSVQLHPNWVLVKWNGVRGIERERMYLALREYRDNQLYYFYQHEVSFYEHSVTMLKERESVSDKSELHSMKERWSSFEWMVDDEWFGKLLGELSEHKLPPEKLEAIFDAAAPIWERLFDCKLQVDISRFYCWQHWVDWLKEVRASVQVLTKTLPYSPEVTNSIMKAVAYIQQNLEEELHMPEVARLVGVSRSYFSRCFRDSTGKTFNDYVRDIRIDHAKKLLKETNKSITWIASQSGYPNEKYFCKVFRDVTGSLPSLYRKNPK